MSHTTLTLYYTCLGVVVLAQTIATVVSGGSLMLSSSAMAELKMERQQLQQFRQEHITKLTQFNALSALPADATAEYTAIAHPIVIASTDTVASTNP